VFRRREATVNASGAKRRQVASGVYKKRREEAIRGEKSIPELFLVECFVPG